MTTLENRNFIATPADIRTLAAARLAAAGALDTSGTSYLRAVVATTVAELGGEPRINATKRAAKLTAEGKAAQLAALQTVHERFYAIVTEVSSEGLPGGKAKALELNRRTNFARTAFRAARNWIRAGNDLTAVPPGRVTKRALDVPAPTRKAGPRRVRARVEARAKALSEALATLASVDKVAAIGELETLMGRLAAQLHGLTPGTTADPKQAMAEHRTLRTKGGALFFPVAPEARAS